MSPSPPISPSLHSSPSLCFFLSPCAPALPSTVPLCLSAPFRPHSFPIIPTYCLLPFSSVSPSLCSAPSCCPPPSFFFFTSAFISHSSPSRSHEQMDTHTYPHSCSRSCPPSPPPAPPRHPSPSFREFDPYNYLIWH